MEGLVQSVVRQRPCRTGAGSSDGTMREAFLTELCTVLMPDERARFEDRRGPDCRLPTTLASGSDSSEEMPVAAASVQEFLRAFPALAHELSEALTALSAYLAGSRQIIERGAGFEKIEGAVEQAHLQSARANDAFRQLRESFGKLNQPRSHDGPCR